MFLVLLITAVVFLVVIKILLVFSDKIKFYSTGLDEGFSLAEIALFWKLAKRTSISEPLDLYVSVPTLNMAITRFIADARASGTEHLPEVQLFLSKLYKYRTKIDIQHDNKRGLDSTRHLAAGQKLRIILHGHGVFTSEILQSGVNIAIKIPLQKNILKLKGDEWVGRQVSVYLWRKGDAGYVFDTTVLETGFFNGTPSIHLAHTNTLLRTQKRRSVRAACNIPASLYFIDRDEIDYAVETRPGYKCLLEDISEDGALIRVGGVGRNNVKIKIQFTIDEKTIIMYGVVRAVEYNKTHHQSRLHFEGVHTTPDMKNTILSFVYNTLPQDEKEVLEALSGTEEDASQDENTSQEAVATPEEPEKPADNPSADSPQNESEALSPVPPIETAVSLEDLAEIAITDDPDEDAEESTEEDQDEYQEHSEDEL